MIGFLKGIIFKKKEQSILLDVRDVGYEVYLTTPELTAIQEGDSLFVYIHYRQKEDDTSLFGFLSEETKDVFETLIEMNGVGPKMAMTILSAIDKDRLVAAILTGDLEVLTGIPGVGKKTAQRMIVELQDRLSDYGMDLDLNGMDTPIERPSSAVKDAEEALAFLGYSKKEIDGVLKGLLKRKQPMETDELIKVALKELSK